MVYVCAHTVIILPFAFAEKLVILCPNNKFTKLIKSHEKNQSKNIYINDLQKYVYSLSTISLSLSLSQSYLEFSSPFPAILCKWVVRKLAIIRLFCLHRRSEIRKGMPTQNAEGEMYLWRDEI